VTNPEGAGSLEEMLFESEQPPLLLRKRVIAGIVVAFLVIAGGYLWLSSAYDLQIEIEAEPFRDWMDDLGIWGPIAYMGVLAVSVLFAPIPNAPVFFAAGLAWGPVLGTLYSLAGLLVGSAIAFWVARRMGRRWLPRLVGKRVAARIDGMADTMGGRLVFWVRMLPVLNFDWISYLAGLTSIPFRSYFAWSAAGMVLPTFVAVGAGDGLGRDFRITLFYGGLWILGIVVSAAYFWWRRARWKRDSQPPVNEAHGAEGAEIGVGPRAREENPQ
jgi:uncharacterized membrane protein YdjX (TVP38/TMEM64 family)